MWTIFRDLWDNVKPLNIRIIGAPEEHKNKDHEKVFQEITVENFPKMGKEMITQVQETQRVPNRIFSWSVFLSSSSGTPMILMLERLTLSWQCLRLSSFLLILFSLSVSFISTILSHTSLILSSASVILLLVPSRVLILPCSK